LKISSQISQQALIKDVLSRPIEEIEYIPIIPIGKDEIESVFGSKYSRDESILSSINSLMSETDMKYSFLRNTKRLETIDGKSQADALLERISTSSNSKKVHILIGHNEDGFIRFTDNSSLSIEDVTKISHENSSAFLLLSCETLEYATRQNLDNSVLTTRRLEYSDVFDALMFLEEGFLVRESDYNFNDVIGVIEMGINGLNVQQNLRRKIVVTTVELFCYDNEKLTLKFHNPAATPATLL
jgi:hypothetical protein